MPLSSEAVPPSRLHDTLEGYHIHALDQLSCTDGAGNQLPSLHVYMFRLRREYEATGPRWSKRLDVYPSVKSDPDWPEWKEWDMARKAWKQLGKIEAREA